jgi:hypothetical protein
VPADVCSLLNKHQTVASAECETLASRRALPGVQSTCDLLQEFVTGNPACHRSMKGFGAIKWLAHGGFLVKDVVSIAVL